MERKQIVMKKVINGKMYNTETAERLAEWDNGRWGSFDACSETLYRKRNGELFLHGDGGCRSPYSKFSGDGLEVGSQAIILLSEKEAREWAEEHLNGDEYEEIFGVVEEDESQATITISISADAMDCGQRAAAKRGTSLPALIETLLQSA